MHWKNFNTGLTHEGKITFIMRTKEEEAANKYEYDEPQFVT